MSKVKIIGHYPLKIAWYLAVAGKQSPADFFSAKTAKKIRSALKRLEESDYRFVFEAPTELLLDMFEPIYQANINLKANPNIYSVKRKLSNSLVPEQYWMLNLYHKNDYLGGLLFHDIPKQLMITTAYKVFPKKLMINLPISSTYVAEYLLFQRALSQAYKKIIHGADKNIFGYNNDIGLALFKLQIGAVPYCSKMTQESKTEFIWHADKDVLLFMGDTPGEHCKVAYLLLATTTLEEAQLKYGVLLQSTAFKLYIKTKADAEIKL